MYSAPPSAVSQLGGLGMSALGIYGMSGGFKAEGGMVGKGHANGGLMSAKAYKEGGLAYAGGGEVSSMSTQQLTEMLNNPSTDQFLAAEIEKELMMRRRMEMNPETDQIMAPALGRSGIASIGTGDMVPEEMAGGGIVAFADRGIVNLKKTSPADALDERIRNMEEREAAAYKNLYENNNAFEKSKEAEESIKKEITDSKDKAFWEALTYAGLGTLEGSPDPATRSNPLSNLGYGAQKGLAAYGKSTEKQNQLNKLLLTQGVEQEKAKYGRDVSNLNALQTSLGQAYNRKLLSSQVGAGTEEKALLKVQALINQDDQIPTLIKQRDLYEPNDPKYKAYNDAINSIKKSYFDQVGIKRPFVAPAAVQFPEEKKEPGFFSRLLGGDSETPKNKVVPFSQLPAKG
jgi:flagellar motility protein MotE (MotC chaperone)